VTVTPATGAGAVQLTEAWLLPAVAITADGAPGKPEGVTAFDGADAGPVPRAFVAVTVKVYAVPLTRPPTVAVVAPLVVATRPPGAEVTV
jgi:hypothetical protein